MKYQKKPIVDYVYLAYYYQMNPPKFIFDMLKRIERRNDIKTRINREGREFVVHGITDGEKQMLNLFETGNLNPRSYGTKNEDVVREITEGLNLKKLNRISFTDIEKQFQKLITDYGWHIRYQVKRHGESPHMLSIMYKDNLYWYLCQWFDYDPNRITIIIGNVDFPVPQFHDQLQIKDINNLPQIILNFIKSFKNSRSTKSNTLQEGLNLPKKITQF